MAKLAKYRIYCHSENGSQHWYLPEDAAAPTKCPNDSNHGVDMGSVAVVETFDTDIVKNAVVLSSDPLQDRPWGFNFTAAAGVETVHDELIDEAFAIRGGLLEVESHIFGDEFDVQIVDVNGLVYPAGTVISDYVKKFQVRKTGDCEIKSESISAFLPASVFYLRVKYRSTGGSAVKVGCTLYAYKAS